MVIAEAAIQFIRKQVNNKQPFLAVIWFGSPHFPHKAIWIAFGKIRRELKNLGIYKNTILWYCSDNGGLPQVGTTGGRGLKGDIYEGGLRVPALLEWPARIKKPRLTNVPYYTCDIFPTLLDILQIQIKTQSPIDGISLEPLIMDEMKSRPKPMGFWEYPAKDIKVPSHKWMSELLYEQTTGLPPRDSSRLRLASGNPDHLYKNDSFPEHAAWLNGPWKLHRIQEDSINIKLELYNLAEDPWEKNDLSEQDTIRTNSMRHQI
jgi:arylsulfatase A-like enzyme